MKPNYKTVECYQTFDGKLFINEDKAADHADDILGEELTRLLRISDLDITRSQEYKTLMSWMKEREKLKGIVDKLHAILHLKMSRKTIDEHYNQTCRP